MFFRTKEMKRVVANNKKLSDKIDKMTDDYDNLLEEKRKLRDSIEDLKIQKKVSEEDIKHMVKMREEKLNLEFEKKQVQADKDLQNKLHEASNTYRDKVEKQLESKHSDMKEMYKEIMDLVPKVKVGLKGEI